MKPDRTLVLMADDAEARFLINEGPGTGLKELAGLSTAQFPDLQIEYQDRPVRQTGPGWPGPGPAAGRLPPGPGAGRAGRRKVR